MAVTAAPIIVKLGGDIVASTTLPGIATEIAGVVSAGLQVVVTHGGGPQISELSRRLSIDPRIVGGRRITDAATLEVVKMAIAGRVNVDLCAALRAAGVRPVGLHGAVEAERRPARILAGAGPEPVDLGLVGDVTGFDLPLVRTLLGGGWIPVLACLGTSADGQIYNINADIVANRLAVALPASALVLVTSTPGVLRDVSDPSSRIPSMTVAEAKSAILDGTVRGGMIPKLEESLAALEAGAARICIVDRDLARALREPGAVGTVLVP